MKFRLSGEFGELSPVRNWQPHSGIDLAIPENSTLRAIGEGVVDKVFTGEGAIGKGLSIKFPDGTRAIYGHMNEVKTKVGEHVDAGDVLGLSGSTGNSTAGHLHFGLKDPSGNVVDPTPLAEQLASISGDGVTVGKDGAFKWLLERGKVNNFEHNGVGSGVVESLREHTADVATEIALGIFDALKDFLLGATLVGSALMLILKVAGWKDGGRWTGLLIVANILIKFLFGVY